LERCGADRNSGTDLIAATLDLVDSFQNFIGNKVAVDHLRTAVAAGRLPHALILAGPQGAGKYTLALMLAQALNCKNQPRDGNLASFCGTCTNCVRIAESFDLQTRIDEALETREAMREVDKKDTRILVQTHPDVLVLPPDPPQLLIKLGQVRSLMESIYYRPAEGERKIYIFTSTAFMKEAANALLKVLEEPPAYAHIFILAENPGELLPTIRSRCGIVRLGAIPAEEIEVELKTRKPDWKPAQRALVARLAQGAIGRALGFDLAAYLAGRADALIFLQNAVNDPDHTALFKVTETYRAGADGAQKTTALLRALSSLLEDVLLTQSGAPQLIHNVDIAAQIETFAAALSFKWIEQASRALDQVESGMRRNLLRSLSLDAFAAQLAAR
jgi:DNA polymerase-3 subunit delta'